MTLPHNDSSMAPDLAAYFSRIGYAGPKEPSMATLRALQQRHIGAIPFEAINVLLDRGIDLTPAAIDDKLITGRRGGYCFEQNNLFMRVLQALGFQVEGWIAQVRWNAGPEAAQRPRTHMVLRVTLDQVEWLVDVGFGSCVPSAPLRLDSADPQATRHGDFRITPVNGEILLEAQVAQEWLPVYQILPLPQKAADYEMANWYSSTYPASHFRNTLIVSLTTPEARHVLLNNRLTIRYTDGAAERRFLNADQLARTLADTFGLPVAPEWRPMLERAARHEWEQPE